MVLTVGREADDEPCRRYEARVDEGRVVDGWEGEGANFELSAVLHVKDESEVESTRGAGGERPDVRLRACVRALSERNEGVR